MSRRASIHEPLSLWAAVAWAWVSLGAAVYLTLLPFEFGDVSLARAWEIYRNMSMSGPGVSGRQQFMANLLMFLPLGFFWSAWLAHGSRSRTRATLVFLFVAALGLAVTMTVEFLQIWLPFRYPAGADILGNFSGAVVGSVLWFALRARLSRWLATLARNGPEALRLALFAYAAAYAVTGLLPFDFVLSQSEFLARLASDNWGWWTAPGACTEGLRCLSWLSLEVLAAIPLGVLLAQLLGTRTGRYLRLGIPLAVAMAVGLELLNLVTLSGITEGRSVLLRTLGLIAGLGLARRLPAHPHGLVRSLQSVVVPVLAVGVPLYLLLLLGLNHDFGPYRSNMAEAWRQLQDLRLWPFYYHYHVQEVVALRSTALHLSMYMPIGLFVWLWQLRHPLPGARMHVIAGATGALVALIMEGGKLFVAGARPDPASLVLAAIAAMTVAAICRWLIAASASRGVPAPDAACGHRGAVDREPRVHRPGDPRPLAQGNGSLARRLLAALMGSVTLALALAWPVLPGALVLALAAYAVLLWWRPHAWLLVIPALIPVLDLYLLTGRVYLEELDLFIMTTLAVGLWRGAAQPLPALLPAGVRWPLGVLLVSTAIGVLIALVPLPAWDPGQAVHYATSWNALRVAKGLLWAVLLLAMLAVSPLAPRVQLQRWFLPGVGLGLAAALLHVLWERATYPGLFNLDSGYRISGLFADMHVGGPSIETYLVLALPLALVWMWQQRPGLSLFGTLLFAGVGAYAVWMTYSRGGYLGLVVAVAVMAGLATVVALRGRQPGRGRLLAWALVPTLVIVAVATPLTQGFAEQRLGQVQQDLATRMNHWRMALDLRDDSALAPVFGRGVGSFPEAYRAGNPDGILPANFAYTRAGGPPRLRLGGGDSLYLNQRLDVPRDAAYRVSVRARSDAPAGFRLFICEKPVRHSFACRSAGRALAGGGDWETLEWAPDLESMESGDGPLQRGLVFSIAHTARATTIIEFDQLTLTDAQGRQHLKNPDFNKLGRHWYFTTDHLWPWRVENQWLEIYFDQGWLGVLAFVWLLVAALGLLFRRALGGDITALGIAAGISGALAIGLFGTLFFSPRIALLFYLALLLGVAGNRATERQSYSGGDGQPVEFPDYARILRNVFVNDTPAARGCR